MTTVAGLAQWTAGSVRRVGRQRLTALLEVYRATGHLTPGLRDVLLQLTQLTEEEPPGRVTMQDCIGVLLHLDGLLTQKGVQATALFSLLLEELQGDHHR